MPGQFQSSNDRDPSGVTLDRMPPSPPDRKGTTGKPGLGEMGGSPALMALNGLEMVENGMQLVATALPQLGTLVQPMSMMIMQLRQAVPQALAGGGGSAMGASPLLAPPPMAAMGGPPGPQMGGGMVPAGPPQTLGQ